VLALEAATGTVRVRTPRRQRWLGFGERSDAVSRTGGTVVNEVSEGPFASESEYDAVSATIPPWGLRRARDATYFPMPWALSSRGFGLLVEGAQTSRFDVRRDGLDIAVEGDATRLLVVRGPRPAGAVRRLTALVGRQPEPAAPWVLGPWFQTGHANQNPAELSYVQALRDADAPVSVAETHLRYLPCGVSGEVRAAERARTAGLHALGLATVSYLNSEVCADQPLYEQGAVTGAFQRTTDGTPYVFTAFVGGRGATPVVQFDFAREAGAELFASVADQIAADGHDGFM
jgi:alpha-glucosidase (family GH31 glycosyl hydrolase)